MNLSDASTDTNMRMQDNVALIAVLEAMEPPPGEAAGSSRRQLICVANTHIHANPELNDVKLWQVSLSPLAMQAGVLLVRFTLWGATYK